MNDVLLDPYHAISEDECLAPEEMKQKKPKTLRKQLPETGSKLFGF